MRKIWQIGVGILGCSGLIVWISHTLPSIPVPSRATIASPKALPTNSLHYQVYQLPQSEVYTLTLDATRYPVQVGISKRTNSLAQFADREDAIAVLNAGFFDPVNQKSTAYITIDGQQVADPHENERLTQNPKMQPYLNQIFNRTEFRRYQCGQRVQYAIAAHQDAIPSDCQLVDAVGGGPRLLPTLTASEEGFVDAATGRDAIGMNQPNARSAVGITKDGAVVLVMVAQKPEMPTASGLSLSQLAGFMKGLGVQQAMNLDGGSSSAMLYQGRLVYGKLNENGKPIQRPVKSVLMVKK
ncbi:MAG: phosphodiester glycosidase family protein [Myxacorys chilensis ATA2-1-KO14]|nr:phosphodiester glycosidase family protein [Myxacorys chilensis ATA2-1-KO14]